MSLRVWITLAFIAILGWSAAGMIALLLVAQVGWIGLGLIGLVICLIAARVELDADYPAHAPHPHLLAHHYKRLQEGNAEERLARWAERLERRRLLYIVRTMGIALILLGAVMFLRHQI